MHDYLKEFKIIIDQLLACKVKIGEEELQTYVLNGLPLALDVFYAIFSTRGVPITLAELESLLVCKESSKNDR
jgi:hypothetical protein